MRGSGKDLENSSQPGVLTSWGHRTLVSLPVKTQASAREARNRPRGRCEPSCPQGHDVACDGVRAGRCRWCGERCRFCRVRFGKEVTHRLDESRRLRQGVEIVVPEAMVVEADGVNDVEVVPGA